MISIKRAGKLAEFAIISLLDTIHIRRILGLDGQALAVKLHHAVVITGRNNDGIAIFCIAYSSLKGINSIDILYIAFDVFAIIKALNGLIGVVYKILRGTNLVVKLLNRKAVRIDDIVAAEFERIITRLAYSYW